MKYLCSLIFFSFGAFCFSQQLAFQKLYGRSNFPANAAWGQITLDGGCIMMVLHGYPDNSWHPGLIKTDMYGDTLWTMNYGLKTDYLFSQGQQTADSGYILTGGTSILGSNYEAWLMKTDAGGKIEWLKKYGGPNDDYGYSVIQTNDGGYIMAGGTESFGQGNLSSDVYLVRTNSQGDTLWTRTYGNSKNDEGWAVRQTSDNGFILAGSYRGVSNEAYLIKIDASGDTLWTRTFGSSLYGLQASDVRQTSNGEYIMIGAVSGTGAGANDVCLIKTDSNGNVAWSKTYGNIANDEGYSVKQISGGSYILAGIFGNQFRDAFMIKTNAQGDTLWTRLYGELSSGPFNDAAFFADETPDKGYVLAGSTQQPGHNLGESAFLIKTDSLGRSGCSEFNTQIFVATFPLATSSGKTYVSYGGNVGNLSSTATGGFEIATACEFIGINEVINNIDLHVSPNPFTNSTVLTLPDQFVANSTTELVIYNELGQKMRKQNITAKITRIDKRNLEKGIYFIAVISDGNTISTGKFIIQ